MAGTWSALTSQPNFDTSTMILLTDGRVMVQEEGTAHWHALTPDQSGGYGSGTWSVLADMSVWRRYYASGVLRDGRVVICGGEQSGVGGDTNKGEVYDPVADSWSPISTPPWAEVGDAASCILPDGRMLIGALETNACIIYDPATDSWRAAASKAVRSNEESWVLQPDNTILTTQCFPPYQSEKYLIDTDSWKNEGPLPVTLCDTTMHEIGPGVLMYNGNSIYFGAAKTDNVGKTAVYSPPVTPGGTGTWRSGPDIPSMNGEAVIANDCPAVLLPNGKVLITAAPWKDNDWGSPIYFFEYDPYSGVMVQAPTPSNDASHPTGVLSQLYWSRMMLLPTGQVLFSPSSNNVQVYTPEGAPREEWRPTISAIVSNGQISQDYLLLQGTQLNGFSQANMYGDDCSAATNYPLVRLRNSVTGRTCYARTFAFSTMGVATGHSLQSVRFSVSGLPAGNYDLSVIANGISSHERSFAWPSGESSDAVLSVEGIVSALGRSSKDQLWATHRERIHDRDTHAFMAQLRLLQNAVKRLEALVTPRDVPSAAKKPGH